MLVAEISAHEVEMTCLRQRCEELSSPTARTMMTRLDERSSRLGGDAAAMAGRRAEQTAQHDAYARAHRACMTWAADVRARVTRLRAVTADSREELCAHLEMTQVGGGRGK